MQSLSLRVLLLAGLTLAPSLAFGQAPPNDNFANAQALLGPSGSVTGSNIGATREPGEPTIAGNPGGQSVWYSWTAPFSGSVTFTTYGSDFDTLLGVYLGTNVAGLTLVADNNNANNTLQSSVTFIATAGTTYAIAVDGFNAGGSYGPAQGSIVLNWGIINGAPLAAGDFHFTSALYLASDRDASFGPIDPFMVAIPPRLTITRDHGSAGRVAVSYTVTAGLYTNVSIYTVVGLNLLSTNNVGGTISFTNVYSTNTYVTNITQNLMFGRLVTSEFYNLIMTAVTNNNGAITTFFGGTNNTGPFGVVPCIAGSNAVVTVDTNQTPNVTTTLVTQTICTNWAVTNIIPSDPAFIPVIGETNFDDFQMSADIFLNYGPSPNLSQYPPIILNRYLVGTITSVALDPLESQAIAAPTASTALTNATLDILNDFTWDFPSDENAPHVFDSGLQGTNVFELERSTLRCSRNVNGTTIAKVYVLREGLDFSQATSVNYRIDHLKGPIEDNGNNIFPEAADEVSLQPGSDYALPPGAQAYGVNPDFQSVSGIVNFGAFDGVPKEIDIPITNYDQVSFNEDLLVELYFPNPQPTDKLLGNVHYCVLTILFDDIKGDVQPAGAVDRMHDMDDDASTTPPYNLRPGANGTVYAVAVQPDGRALVAGDFTGFNTVPRPRLARMLSNGQLDPSFNPPGGANLFVSSMLLDPAGNVVVGGAFSAMDGINRNGVARLFQDGTLDTSFNPGAGANDIVWSLAFQGNGSILVGGQFTTFNLLPQAYMARVSSNGVYDVSFTPSIDGIVDAITVQPNGKILIGGDFQNVDGAPRSRIARLNPDGTLDTSFDPGYGADDTVYAITLQPNGQILAGGSFHTVGGLPFNSIVRLNPDGSIDQTFNPGSGADDTIYTINVQPDGGIFAGGMFTSFNQTRRVAMVRLLPNGNVDTSFMDTAYNQFAGLINHYWDQDVEPRNFVYSSALQPDGNYIIGGGFSRVGGGFTRSDVRWRENVARIIGGSTPGPGNISLALNPYYADQFSGQLFINLTRQNGTLGPAQVTLGPSTTPPGPGSAVDGVDFSFNPLYGNPYYTVSWARPTWHLSDGLFGQNQGFSATIDPATTVNSILNKAYISILDNTNMAGNRSLNLQLSHPTAADSFLLGGENIPLGVALGQASAPLTILDYHNQPGALGFSLPNYTILEANTNALITVTRTNGTAGLVTVNYSTANGTATNGISYRSAAGQLVFLPGVTNQTFQVPIIHDNLKQGDHTVLLNLSTPSGGSTLGLSNSVLTIIDVNITGGYVEFNSPTYGTNENAVYAAVTVNRNGGGAGALSVQLTATNGSAISGYNFAGITNTLTWVNGDVQPKVVPIRIFDDGVVETNPLTINLTLSAPTLNGVTNLVNLGKPSSAVLYITNSDFPGQLSFSTPSYNVNSHGGPAIITVVRTGGSAGSETVNFATLPGTSTPGVDFIPTNGTFVFNPGEVSKSFTVTIPPNSLPEPPRFFAVSLTSSSSTVLGNPSIATVNIVDDLSVSEPPGGSDTTLDPSLGFNDNVRALAFEPDGRILAGGDFTLADGVARNRIARLNTDFTLDTSFSSVLTNAGADSSVLTIVCQTDRRILVGGQFTNFNGIAQNYVARLNADGTLDSTFNPGSSADSPVYAAAETFVGPDRKLLLGGPFLHFNGLPENYLVRLNDNGFVDGTFQTGSGPNGTVFAIALQPDSKILIGGDFTSVNGVSRNHVARLNANGSLDLSFDPGAGPNDSVRAIAVQLDGRIVLGGIFTNVNGAILNHVARLNTDGSVDNTFTPGLGANDLVTAVTIEPDTRILLGGQFTTCNGVTRGHITRLNNDGTQDTMINFGLGADSFVSSILVQTNGMIVFGGGFNTYNGQPAHHVARIYGGTVSGDGSLQFDSPYYQVTEDGTNITVHVLRLGGTSGDISVQVNTADESAIAGVNYLPVSTNLFFPAGEVIQSVTIPVIRDFVITTNLTVGLELSNPQPPNGPSLGNIVDATLSIINVDSGVSFSSGSYSVAENDPSGFALIYLYRTGSTNGTSTVEFLTTTNGTAIPFTNFIPVTNIVTFTPGVTSNYVTVPVIHTPQAEGNTTVVMDLTNAVNTLLLKPSTATLTVVDVDRYPGQFVFSQTNYIVNEDAGYVYLTVMRSNGYSGVVSVNYNTVDGSAHGGLNYGVTNGVLNFADGEVSKTIAVPIDQVSFVEGTTTFFVQLSNPTGGASITGVNPAPVSIIDDHIGIGFSSPIYITDKNAGTVTLTVNRIGTNATTSVSYATTNGTAIAGTNYGATSGMLVFNPGETIKTLSIPVYQDNRVTGPLSFQVSLFNASAPAQIFTNNPTTVTISDTNPGFAFTNANFFTFKSATNVIISVVRSNANTGLLTVNFATVDGTASATNGDYVATNGLLTFSNGIALQSFAVHILPNLQVSPDRTFFVTLTNPTPPAQLLDPSTALITITNDVAGISFSSPSYRINENGGLATITVLRSGFTNSTVAVTYSTAPGDPSTLPGVNYSNVTGTLVFTNGVVSQSFAVPIIDDSLITGDKTVLLSLSPPTGKAVLVNPNQALLTMVESDGSLIVPAGVALLSESGPVNHSIDPGETVTMDFAFRDSAGTNTSNLVATLLATNGIVNPSAAQSYGALVVHGPSVYRPFTFTANATNGQVIQATFQMTDGNAPTNFAVVSLVVGTVNAVYSNSAPIVINDYSNATPYPSIISVSNMVGNVTQATVTFTNLNHDSPRDIDSLLVSPSGQKTYLMAKCGSQFTIHNVTLTFSNGASSLLPQNSQIVSGSYLPTSYAAAAPPFPGALTPPPPYATNLSVFNGSNPNGNWALYIIDDTPLYAGIISNGWSINFNTAQLILGNADVGLAMTAAPEPVIATSNLTYTLTLTNYGPLAANNIVVTNLLPAGALYVGGTPSAGSVSNNAGVVTWSIASLANGGWASLQFVVTPMNSGTITNIATVTSSPGSLNPDDSSAVAISTVALPTADLAVSLADAPDPVLSGNLLTYSITLSNLGPATATNVTLLDILPPGVTVVSATPSGYTVLGGVLTFPIIPALGDGSSVSASIVVRPFIGGTITNTVSASSPVLDPFKLNSFAAVKTVVEPVVASVSISGNTLTLTWTADASNYYLETTTNLAPPVVWVPLTSPAPVLVNGQKVLTLPLGSGSWFFRLHGQSQ